MKKFVALLLALSMVFCFAACGSSDEKNPDDTSAKTLKILDTEYANEEYAICIAKDNDELLGKVNEALAALKEDGTAQAIVDKYISGVDHGKTFQADTEGKEELHMATNAFFPPYEYYEGDAVVGIDIEMAQAIADYLDMKLIVDDMDFDAILPAIQSGKADMGMAGLTVTPTRAESVNFSEPYANGIQVIVVTEDSPITTVDDLLDPEADYVAGVQQGTTSDVYLSDSYENGGITEERVSKFNKSADAIQALLTGKIDCVVVDNEPAKAFLETYNG